MGFALLILSLRPNYFIFIGYLGLDARKPVFGDLRTTQAQTGLRIRPFWSVPLLFAFWNISYVYLLQVKFEFSSWGFWFEFRFVGNPEDRFSHDETHLKSGGREGVRANPPEPPMDPPLHAYIRTAAFFFYR